MDRLLDMSKTLEDCEHALGMANDETDKANKVARGAKAKVVELDGRLYQAEVELQREKFRAAELERELTTYRAQQSEAKLAISGHTIIEENQDTIKIHSDRVCFSVSFDNFNVSMFCVGIPLQTIGSIGLQIHSFCSWRVSLYVHSRFKCIPIHCMYSSPSMSLHRRRNTNHRPVSTKRELQSLTVGH